MRVMGIDGCRAGWVGTIQPLEGGVTERIVSADLGLLLGMPDLAAIAIDMPMGLPALIGPEGRGPEKALRPLLGERQSSVFSVPARAAVEASDYADANQRALETSDPPRKVSKQCFYLFPKIRALDASLRADPALAARVYECHPEGAFMAMNGMAPLRQPKKVKGRVCEAGAQERIALLTGAGFAEAFLRMRVAGAGLDDCLDSAACAWSAARIVRGQALSFPDPPLTDPYGLRIAILI